MTAYVFNGTAKWAKVRKPVKGYGSDEENEYTIDLYMTDESWETFKDSGIQLQPKEDDDGEYATFRRKHKEMNYGKGEMQTNGPPKVYLRDVETGEYNVWDDGLIGNGSKVAITVDVFKTRNGYGHRLLRVFVDDLIPYEGNSESNAPDQAKTPF